MRTRMLEEELTAKEGELTAIESDNKALHEKLADAEAEVTLATP